MTELIRVKLRWSGFQGGPGYSIFHMRDFGGTGEWSPTNANAAAAAAKVKTFCTGIAAVVPNGLAMQVENDVEVIEDSTGEMTRILSAGNPTAVGGTAQSGASYAGPVGAVINWRTGVVRRGRRIKGRTFLVPLSGNAYESNGTLNAGALTAIQSAATALATDDAAPDLGVYARPHKTKNTDGSWTTVPDGQWALCSSATVPDMVAVLRSRRD